MRNNPSKNSGGGAQAKLIVTRNPRHPWKLWALVLGGGYNVGRPEIYHRVHFAHTMMLTVPAATGGEGILSRRKEGRCHGQAHDNGQ